MKIFRKLCSILLAAVTAGALLAFTPAVNSVAYAAPAGTSNPEEEAVLQFLQMQAAQTASGTAADAAATTAAQTQVKTAQTVSSLDVYDMVLFWGQSNMLGSAVGTDTTATTAVGTYSESITKLLAQYNLALGAQAFEGLSNEQILALIASQIMGADVEATDAAQVSAAVAGASRVESPEISAAGANANVAADTTAVTTGDAGTTEDAGTIQAQSPVVNSVFRFSAADAATYSAYLGIDADILAGTRNARTTLGSLPAGIAWQYYLSTNSFTPITTGTHTGESGKGWNGVWYNAVSGRFERCKTNPTAPKALGASTMTNMVNEFCRVWYARTGHKLIVIFAAIGGAPVQAFLPMADPYYLSAGMDPNQQYAFTYEAIAASVQGAEALAAVKGYQIAGHYWVSMQGEADVTTVGYADLYRRVIGNFAALGFTNGALVETSYPIGYGAAFGNVLEMHNIQEALIANNPDTVLGSAFDWNHYIPDEASYLGSAEEQAKWGGLPYAEAYARARMCVDSCAENMEHLNSAALSQIGRDTANNLAASVGY